MLKFMIFYVDFVLNHEGLMGEDKIKCQLMVVLNHII